MKIYCTAAYLSGYYKDGPLYEPHMSCMAFVKSIKGQNFRVARILGGRRMHPSNPSNALLVFAEWAASMLRDTPAPVWLVPVPGSKLGLRVQPQNAGSKAHRLAGKAAEGMGGKAEVADVLRFVEPHKSARDGNALARDRDWLASQLRVISSPPTSGCVILIDDVLTSGAHLMASHDVLLTANSNLNPIAFCAARTVRGYVPNPYPYPEVVTHT